MYAFDVEESMIDEFDFTAVMKKVKLPKPHLRKTLLFESKRIESKKSKEPEAPFKIEVLYSSNSRIKNQLFLMKF